MMRLFFVCAAFVAALLVVGPVSATENFSYFDQPSIDYVYQDGKSGDFNLLAQKFANLLEAREWEEAVEAGQAALDFGVDTEDPQLMAQLALNLARLYDNKVFDSVKAWETYEVTATLTRAAWGEDDVRVMTPLYEEIRLRMRAIGPIKARQIFRDFNRISDVHFLENSVENARLLLLDADLNTLEASVKIPGKMRWTRVREAKNKLKQARKIFLANEDYSGAADTWFFMGEWLNDSRNGRGAIGSMRKAPALYEQSGILPNDKRLIRIHAFFAQIYIRLEEEKNAQPHIDYVTSNQSVRDKDDLFPLYRVAAVYPYLSYLLDREGRVLVKFIIDVDGGVVDPEVVWADPKEVFDEAALKAVRQWRYIPVRMDGDPVQFESQILLSFSASNGQDHTPIRRGKAPEVKAGVSGE